MSKSDLYNSKSFSPESQWTTEQVFARPSLDLTRHSTDLPIMNKALAETYGRSDILPLEFFKLYPDSLRDFFTAPIVKTFLSSGTTREERSQSHFSEEGLALYKKFSCLGFAAILRHFFSEPKKAIGLSLIPTISDWDDSSLAQMINWLSQEWPLEYWNGKKAIPEQKLWVFGTAFHFVQLADAGIRWQLPPGSIVIETGGTKGRSRSVSRSELYLLIEEHLGVPPNHIVSEYGMCELASQAYDFVKEPDGPRVALKDRYFRFPSWCPIAVVDRSNAKVDQGEGALVIADRPRIDMPWPIRTEDLAEIFEDGSFQLLGRVPNSPLKGCSLLAEKPPAMSYSFEDKIFTGKKSELPLEGLAERAAAIHELAQSLLLNFDWWKLWQEELNSERLVTWLKLDLHRSLPKTDREWLRAAHVALGNNSHQRWLIIAPDSHSYAWLYPLLMGSILGLKMHVRSKANDSLLLFMKNLLAGINDFSVWDSQKRIGFDELPDVDAILAYGASETISTISTLARIPIQGFGTYLTASLLLTEELAGHLEMVWKDAFSLMQKGCMSSRALFLLDQSLDDGAKLRSTIEGLAVTPIGKLPLGVEIALEHYALAKRCLGKSMPKRGCVGAPLIELRSFSAELTLDELILERPFSLCVVHVRQTEWPEFSVWLGKQKDLQKIASSPLAESLIRSKGSPLEWVGIGQANAPAWTGHHQGRPLFETKSG